MSFAQPDLNGVDGVDRALEVKSPEAEVSIIFEDSGYIQRFRVHWLKHLRDEWEWVDERKSGAPFVMLKRR